VSTHAEPEWLWFGKPHASLIDKATTCGTACGVTGGRQAREDKGPPLICILQRQIQQAQLQPFFLNFENGAVGKAQRDNQHQYSIMAARIRTNPFGQKRLLSTDSKEVSFEEGVCTFMVKGKHIDEALIEKVRAENSASRFLVRIFRKRESGILHLQLHRSNNHCNHDCNKKEIRRRLSLAAQDAF